MLNLVKDSLQIFLSISLPEEASQGFIKAKIFLNETTNTTINHLKDITSKSISSVVESAEKTNHSFSKVAEETKNSLTQTVTDTANNLTQFTTNSVDKIAEQAKTVEDSLLVTGSTIENSLEQRLHQVEQLSNTISTETERTITSFFTHQIDNVRIWIDAHPIISGVLKFLAWAVNHPLPSLVIILLLLFILVQLFKIFSRLLEKGLLVTFTAPFKLVVPLLKFNFKSLLKDNAKSTFTSSSEDSKDRISYLLSRLEAIKQEQNNILEEISTIVATNK